jgi:drug/metabolite transporter (DMT)-like permease
MRRVLAVIVGCMVAILVLFVGEMLVQLMYPSPSNIDHTNAEELKKLMESAPPISLVLVLLSAFLGAFVGGIIATVLMKTSDKITALLVGAVLTILGILNLLVVPHPIWFIIPALLVYFIGAWLGMMIYSKFKKNKHV